jgi:hypothetical protein
VAGRQGERYGPTPMGNYDVPEGDAPGTAPAQRGAPPWVIVGTAVAALVIGLGGGYLIGARTSAEPAATAAPTPAPSTTVTTAPAPPCLAAGQTGAAVLEQLELAVQAIGALDPTALRGVLDRLQPLQADLERSVASCSDRLTPAPPQATPTG